LGISSFFCWGEERIKGKNRGTERKKNLNMVGRAEAKKYVASLGEDRKSPAGREKALTTIPWRATPRRGKSAGNRETEMT